MCFIHKGSCIINTGVYSLWVLKSHSRLYMTGKSAHVKVESLDPIASVEAVPNTTHVCTRESIRYIPYFSSTCSSCPATLDFSWISPARLSRSALRLAV